MNLKGIFQYKSSSSKLFLFVLIVFIFTIIGSLMCAVLDVNNLNQLKIAQLIMSVFIFIIPPLLFTYLSDNTLYKSLGFKRNIKRQNALLVFLMILFIQPFVAYSIHLNTGFLHFISEWIPSIINSLEQMESHAEEITKTFLQMDTISDLLFNLFLIALIPAIGEEMFFRGVIQKKLQLIITNPHIAIFISAFIFSAIHMQFFGLLPRFVLGIILGYLFYYSANLWMSVLAHFINNALGVLLMYSAFANKLNPDIVNIKNTEITFIQAFFSVSVVLFFIYLYKQINNKKS